MKMVERFHGELIPAQETRQAKLEDDADGVDGCHHAETIVGLTGAIARKPRTHDEQRTPRSQEGANTDRFAHHIQRWAQFRDERATRVASSDTGRGS